MRKRRPRLPPSALKPAPRSVMKPAPAKLKAAPAGIPPHPWRPPYTRDPSSLNDLFALFPDLPWAARPRRAVAVSTLARRLRPFKGTVAPVTRARRSGPRGRPPRASVRER